jgi:hypothetical protein
MRFCQAGKNLLHDIGRVDRRTKQRTDVPKEFFTQVVVQLAERAWFAMAQSFFELFHSNSPKNCKQWVLRPGIAQKLFTFFAEMGINEKLCFQILPEL